MKKIIKYFETNDILKHDNSIVAIISHNDQ